MDQALYGQLGQIGREELFVLHGILASGNWESTDEVIPMVRDIVEAYRTEFLTTTDGVNAQADAGQQQINS